MPGPADRFNAEARAQARRLPPLQLAHVRLVVEELERAQRRIARLIASAPTAASAAHRQRVRREIDTQLERFRAAASATGTAGIEAAFGAGRELMTAPLAAAGFPQLSAQFRLNPRALAALRASAIDRIRDTTAQAQRRIAGVLAQQLAGTLRLDQAVALVNRILGGNARRRAMTITYTEIGRAYSVASFESFQRADQLGVKFARQWRRSGKQHPRVSHVHAHGQLVRGLESFVIVDVKTGESERLRFPRDPAASAANTINCGCVDIPVVDGSSFDTVNARTGELQRRVVTLPTDPNAPPRLLTPEERAAENLAYLARFNARMTELLPTSIGLAITRAADTPGLLARATLETNIALWWKSPRGHVAVGVAGVGITELLGARSGAVSLSPYTRGKQIAHHAEMTVEDYARLPSLLESAQPVESFVSRARHVSLVYQVGGALWLVVLKTDATGRAWLQSYRRTSARDVARLRAVARKQRGRP